MRLIPAAVLLASGGRYDDVSAAFGRERSAVGFSADLSVLKNQVQVAGDEQGALAIFAPSSSKPAFWERVSQLRSEGERVIVGLAGQQSPETHQRCDRILVEQGESWLLSPLHEN